MYGSISTTTTTTTTIAAAVIIALVAHPALVLRSTYVPKKVNKK
jgi:hypothetical protein